MNTKLIIAGTVYAISKKTFEDNETIYAQFLNKQDTGGVEIMQVKMTHKEDISTLKEGLNIKIPIKVSSYQGKLYYTQIEPIIK